MELEEDVAVEVREDLGEVDVDVADAVGGDSGTGVVVLTAERTESSVVGGESSTTTGFSRSAFASSRIFATIAARASSSISASTVSSPTKASLQ